MTELPKSLYTVREHGFSADAGSPFFFVYRRRNA